MVVNCGRRERLGSRRDIYGHIEVCFYIVAGRNMNSLMVSVRTETLCRYIPTAPLSLYSGDDHSHLPGELGLQLSP